MFRTLIAVLLIGTFSGMAGCNSMRESSRQMIDVFKPGDYADGTDHFSDPWVQQAGVEARGNRPRESVGEPAMIHNLLTSPKARDIERNVGLDVETSRDPFQVQ